MNEFLDIYELLEKLDLEESAKTDFINKFGEETYNNFIKAKQRLANKGLSVDFGQYLKKDKQEIDDLILSLYDNEDDAQKKRAMQGKTREVRGKYNFLGEKYGYLVYQPLDYESSMDLGINTGWCTTGRWKHAGHPEFTPNASAAKQHFNSYTNGGCVFFYLLDPETFYGKYALVFRKRVRDSIDVNVDDHEVTYIHKKADGGLMLSQVFDDKDIDVGASTDVLRKIADEIIDTKNKESEKSEILCVNRLINSFELDNDGVIIKYFGDDPNAIIPVEATAFDKSGEKRNDLFAKLRAKAVGAWLNAGYSNDFYKLTGDVTCLGDPDNFIDDLPVRCTVRDRDGNIIRQRVSPDELFYLRGIYDNGFSQNARYFFVSNKKAADGMISVSADGTEWSRNHTCEDMILFSTKEDADAFAKNLIKAYPQYQIRSYQLKDLKHNIAKSIVNNTNKNDYDKKTSTFGKCLINRRNKYAMKSITEGASKLSQEKVMRIIDKCLREFDTKIFPIQSNKTFKFSFDKFYSSSHRHGTTSFGFDDDEGCFICQISINENLLREGLEGLFINTVWHELCHYAVWKLLVDDDAISLSNNHGRPGPAKGKENIFEAEQKNSGHGPLWLEFADKVNRILSPVIPISPFVSDREEETFLQAFDDNEFEYEIICQNKYCGKKVRYVSLDMEDDDELMTVALLYAVYIKKDLNIINSLSHIPSCKKCGSELYINIYNDDLRKFLDENYKKIIYNFVQLQFMRMMRGIA